MKQRLRVLHVLNELRPSGAEIMLRIAAPLFREHQIECDLLATGASIGPYAPVLAAEGYHIHHIPFQRSPAFFLSVARFARREGYDVVHLHAERAFFAYVLAARLLGIRRLVRTVHNNFNFSGWLSMRRGLERRLAERLGVRFIAIAPGVAQTERNLYGTTPHLIPNWFDSNRFHPVTPTERLSARARLGLGADEFVIVTVGNCSQVKNHTALIEALARCSELPWRYVHVGLEEPGEPERALTRRLNISNRIQFIGAVDDVLPLLQAADLYVMPSHFEGLGIATLEALAVGLPVLLTEVPGLVDFRQYLDDLHYCEPDTQSIANALRPLIEQHTTGLQGAEDRSAAIHRAFGSRRGVQAYCSVYADLVMGTGSDELRPKHPAHGATSDDPH